MNSKTMLKKIKRKQPNLRTGASYKYIKGGYNILFSRDSTFFLRIILFCVATPFFLSFFGSVKKLLLLFYALQREYTDALFAVYLLLIIFFTSYFFLSRPPEIYLIDFSLYRGEDYMKLSKKSFEKIIKIVNTTEESIQFQTNVLSLSEIGEDSWFPPQIMEDFPKNIDGQNLKNARMEAETVIFSCVRDVLLQTGIDAKQIDILVVNCSLFCPTPSLSAMVVNHFKMRENIKSYNLGGMGCSAGLISIDLAKDLLKLTTCRYALVVSTENITLNWYKGHQKSMLIANTLFRVGGAAIILSNAKKNAKLRLVHTIRTHKGRDNECFDSVVQEEDEAGNIGVRLNRNVMDVAGKALKANITVLAPLTLPILEQMKYFLNLSARLILTRKLPAAVPGVVAEFIYGVGGFFLDASCNEKDASEEDRCFTKCTIGFLKPRRLIKFLRRMSQLPDDYLFVGEKSIGEPYIPNFTKAFEHFCIHAGGKRVIEAIETNLNLPKEKVKASKEILFRHGNTSSSSIWYEMDYHFKQSNIRRGERIWQIAFGSGFKCNSAVWESLRNFNSE